MQVSKAILLRDLRALQRFDTTGSPYIGIQWQADAEKPYVHRSSSVGYIESVGYDHRVSPLVVSLSHLIQVIGYTVAESVELSVDEDGVLLLTGATEAGVSQLRVYTIRHGVTWKQVHDIGPRTVDLCPEGFEGINTSSFTLSSPPVLRRNRLMLPTGAGVIFRNQVPIEAYPYPRDSFLRSLSTLPIEQLYLTRNGYWGAVAGGLRITVAGHRAGDAAFDIYSVGAPTVAELAAPWLLQTLRNASDVAVEGSWITLDPTRGVRARDQFGNTSSWSLPPSEGWNAFAIKPPTARVLHDALNQSQDEVLSLQQPNATTMRLTRGLWEVTFRIYNPESSAR